MKNIKKCLMIDDDTDDQELFEMALADLDREISCDMVMNGIEGLEYLKSNPAPDIIFLDLNMPRMNGKECLKILKEDPVLKEIPVVILSTSINNSDKCETLSLGAVQFITKPSSTSELTTIISEVFAILQIEKTNH